MAAQDVATIQAFINSNFTTNGSNNITGAELQTVLINLTDSFYNSVSTTAVTGSGTTNYITKWATGSTAGAGTWTMVVNAFVPVNNNSTLGSASLGIQSFHAAATSTTAPINLTSSAATDPSTPTEGMLWYNGTNLYFENSSTSIDLLTANPGSGTNNTITMFTPSGTQIGDSPLTVASGDVTLLSGTLGIGAAADTGTQLYIVSGAADEFPLYVDQAYTGGSDVSAIWAQSNGVNAGENIGGEFHASKSTDINIAMKARAGDTGISFDPSTDGFDRIGSVMQTASSSTKVVAGFYASVNGAGTVTSYGGYIQGSNSSSGDVVGLYIDAAITSGTAYIGQWKDGNEAIGKVPTCIDANGKTQWQFHGWTKVTKAHTDFQTAGTTNSITIYTAAAGEIIKNVITDASTGMTGGSIATYTTSVGYSGDNARYVAAFDVFTGSGTSPDITLNNDIATWDSTKAITATAIATGANLDQSVAGSIDFYIQTEKVK